MQDAQTLLARESLSQSRAIVPMKNGNVGNPGKLKAFLEKMSRKKLRWWKGTGDLNLLKKRCSRAQRPKACDKRKPPKKGNLYHISN